MKVTILPASREFGARFDGPVLTAVVGFALVLMALATPGSGVLGATVFARASFQNPVDIKFKLRRDKGERKRGMKPRKLFT